MTQKEAILRTSKERVLTESYVNTSNFDIESDLMFLNLFTFPKDKIAEIVKNDTNFGNYIKDNFTKDFYESFLPFDIQIMRSGAVRNVEGLDKTYVDKSELTKELNKYIAKVKSAEGNGWDFPDKTLSRLETVAAGGVPKETGNSSMMFGDANSVALGVGGGVLALGAGIALFRKIRDKIKSRKKK